MEQKDIFISYKSEDFEQALWLKSVLETNRISCWMAPASIPGGSNYAREIPQAIENCRVFVLVLTGRCQDSIWVPKELDRALNCKKPVMPFVLEDCQLTDDFNFYLSNVQRYNAYLNKTAAAQQLLRDIQALLNVQGDAFRSVPEPPVFRPKKEQKPRKKIAKFLFGVLALVLVGALLLQIFGLKRVDAFRDLEITVEGPAPYSKIKLVNQSPDPFLQSISYSAMPNTDLDLGDRVTITANTSKETAKAHGYRIRSFTKEFTVENIPQALTDPTLLQAADVIALREKAELFISGRGTNSLKIICADGSELDLSGDQLANSMTAFDFLEKAYVCTYTPVMDEQKLLLLPFCLTLEDVPYTWFDNQYYEDPLLVDYPALYGYFSLQDLVTDEAGKLIQAGSFGIEMSDLYENKDRMHMNMNNRYPGAEMASGLLAAE